jgi:hypothetical protein
MKKLAVSLMALLFASLTAAAQGGPDPGAPIINPAIDDEAYLRVASEALRYRARHRLSEAEFIRMSREPGAVVLDARSKAKFDELHIEGAINLSFPDNAVDSLATTLPDRNARILIYCNNDFSGAAGPVPVEAAERFAQLPTYVALYDHGCRNVYELRPLLDIEATVIALEGSATPP